MHTAHRLQTSFNACATLRPGELGSERAKAPSDAYHKTLHAQAHTRLHM